MAKDRGRRRSPRDKPRSPSAEPAIRDDQRTPPPSKQRPDSPHLWWARIRIDESVLDGILFLWGEPDDERGLPRLWGELIVAQRKTKAVLKSVDWGSVPPDELVILAAAHEAVRTGIEKFLPPAYADLPASSRESLFCHVLMVIGIGGVSAGRMDHPLDLALTALGLYQAGQHAVTEMARRGKGQIGFYEALVVLGQQVGCPENKAEHALTVIRKAVWGHLPAKTRTEIGGLSRASRPPRPRGPSRSRR